MIQIGKRAPSHFTYKNFSSTAKPLRNYFEKVFSDAHRADGKRFVWDYWHIPGQYTHLRTPAYHFFPKKIYEKFHQQLVLWGRENLGCHNISPPWLSCYVDGCEQNLHADIPHGPWAFVFSLSPEKKIFQGGETIILREEICEYWQNFSKFRGLESKEIFQKISPTFNQLLVFDPRIPHGVTRVQGVQDPRLGRLVIHGWFLEPRPFIVGSLQESELAEKIKIWMKQLSQNIQKEGLSLHGVWSLRFSVNRRGHVSAVRFLTNSLRVTAGGSGGIHSRSLSLLARVFVSQIQSTRFSSQKNSSNVVVPVVFQV